MNKLNKEKQIQVIKALVEGNSIRSAVRMTGVAKNTIQHLLLSVGETCEKYQKENLTGITSKYVQADEIWNYCYAKEKNVPKELKGVLGYGDVWTWVGIDADTKLVISWLVARRDTPSAIEFVTDLRSRIKNRVQLSTDGYKPYFKAVDQVFGEEVDFAIIRKIYGGQNPLLNGRYSPMVCTSAKRSNIKGKPDANHISTSYVERQNLTMRMGMRRFTRLTNAFSKKFNNLRAAVALHFMYYNYCRIHQTLRVTPAMAAKVTDKLWEIEDILALIA